MDTPIPKINDLPLFVVRMDAIRINEKSPHELEIVGLMMTAIMELMLKIKNNHGKKTYRKRAFNIANFALGRVEKKAKSAFLSSARLSPWDLLTNSFELLFLSSNPWKEILGSTIDRFPLRMAPKPN